MSLVNDPTFKKKPTTFGPPDPGADLNAAGAQMPAAATPPPYGAQQPINRGTPAPVAGTGPDVLGHGGDVNYQTLAGTAPPAGDVKPGPTVTPPAATAPPAATPINHADPSWAAKGVDFGKIESGAPVPGQPGATFVHNGQGWTIQQGAAGATPGAGTPGATPGGAADPNAPPATVADAFKKTLLDTMNRGPASLNDPELKNQADAFAVGQTRSAEMQRAQAAERQAMQGGAGVSSGAFDGDVSGINERAGERMSGFNAGLVGDAAKERRQQLMQAAALAGNQLNQDEARALQRELAELDAQIRREGISQQGALGQGDLALRGRLGEGGLNLGLLQALMQNDQFGRGLNQQGAQFGAGLDQQGILGLLGLL
jgi:hypothetical protein